MLITSIAAAGCLASVSGAAAQAIHDQRAVSGHARGSQLTDRQANLEPEEARPLIAPAAACPGQSSLTAPAAAQEQAMLCMVNHARLAFGLRPLAASAPLHDSAAGKSGDILACDEFSHFACDRPFTHWMAQTGYLSQNCWRVGENIAWGRGRFGTVRSIFIAWMRSDSHRENLLGDYAETGLDASIGELEGSGGTRVWTQHFGMIRC